MKKILAAAVAMSCLGIAHAKNDSTEIRRCCINQGRGEAVLTFTRNDMAVTL
ncbi:hypothetical protein LBM341_04878 (plasmid) [Ralstonia solanacearum]|nr:hypothetical protein LBM341_04878 [Ralstonia solanacearum]NKA15844.1 hypothetical protein [Ralstonia solanacearum]NKA50838.1 hypothetical protein [Ralstonia solanacearum]